MRARQGGYEGPAGWVFELTGGALCLDFANTVDNRPTEEARELLRSYPDLVEWSKQVGIINRTVAGKLSSRANTEPKAASKTLIRARTLREALFALFYSTVHGSDPPAEALGILNTEIPMALSSQTLARAHHGYQLKGTEKEDALDLMLPVVVRSSVDLLTSQELDRVRVCAADNCAWLFLDRSRNRTRQWCDMSVCGNRAKARRHYQKTKRALSG
jgi:predicted RNA-binding Zn ribbon-like protein